MSSLRFRFVRCRDKGFTLDKTFLNVSTQRITFSELPARCVAQEVGASAECRKGFHDGTCWLWFVTGQW